MRISYLVKVVIHEIRISSEKSLNTSRDGPLLREAKTLTQLRHRGERRGAQRAAEGTGTHTQAPRARLPECMWQLDCAGIGSCGCPPQGCLLHGA